MIVGEVLHIAVVPVYILQRKFLPFHCQCTVTLVY